MRFVLIAVSVAFSASAPLAARAQQAPSPAPAMVTSDTPEYCNALRLRVAELPANADDDQQAEARSLADEGRHLCDEGQTRAGILRLRRALVLMMRNGHVETGTTTR